ncbi:Rieske (2Fe-2S) protein [Myxococcus sp. XM-1-1-1]|uniref:QcrA and Rieske domain-containing protein n=1 Tax=Myxococcus sp. XM-1-1-1 TaxID=2874602 RepID=UPI001CBF7632|nr:Rieske (2Fe-2S) protein [Myxococcus sp. XM-1-1-1]MBZ4408672.1 Rieske (2Fe-2S) protein [Myxococcus sp. XM-1-1-1]BDT37724.1 Rieske (2Fe-2S) protein [Myxococcus sp. MH1]
MTDLDRRAALLTLARGGCALATLGAGCGGEWREAIVLDPPPEGASCPDLPQPGTAAEGWVEVRLEAHPGLESPGGHARVHAPEALLDVLLVHTTPGCFVALWRICTHGDCGVDWRPGEGVVECPCHGSRFALDGAVLQGPARRPLAAFTAVRQGASVFIHRPR